MVAIDEGKTMRINYVNGTVELPEKALLTMVVYIGLTDFLSTALNSKMQLAEAKAKKPKTHQWRIVQMVSMLQNLKNNKRQ
ncbi:MAG: hypothetical protein JSS78_05720 [Bacteroidetes bacterium]|nr:hypothetical protein [Bacteroidota bacterium]